ncbi:hypothetical protein BD410DRAFT_894076 [Rickenella mellea]|uniref:Uncharacterized protein n=1 Tax=Rickenella mellea TaxID=50990 RepID=A0A4Y7QKQ3_9AGAM|nr:hypothetical protein BD410DRAFT_894076 [Rickenella mellea]
MSSPFDNFRGLLGPKSGIGDVIQLVKDLGIATDVPPLYDIARSEVINAMLLPALQSHKVVTVEGSPIEVKAYEAPLSDSVTIPISDVFGGWLISVTMLNKQVRADSIWYERGLAMMAKIFQIIMESQPGAKKKRPHPFPTVVCLFLSADSCFTIGNSGFSKKGSMYATYACSAPGPGRSDVTKSKLTDIRARYFVRYVADLAKVYYEKSPLDDRLFNCAEVLLILGLATVKHPQTIYLTALRVGECWKGMPSNGKYDLDKVIQSAHIRLCENCAYQAQVFGLQCHDPVTKEIYPLYAASANMSVKDLHGWKPVVQKADFAVQILHARCCGTANSATRPTNDTAMSVKEFLNAETSSARSNRIFQICRNENAYTGRQSIAPNRQAATSSGSKQQEKKSERSG